MVHLKAPQRVLVSGPVFGTLLVGRNSIVMSVSGPVCPKSVSQSNKPRLPFQTGIESGRNRRDSGEDPGKADHGLSHLARGYHSLELKKM
jgi:hypothetical protein